MARDLGRGGCARPLPLQSDGPARPGDLGGPVRGAGRLGGGGDTHEVRPAGVSSGLRGQASLPLFDRRRRRDSGRAAARRGPAEGGRRPAPQRWWLRRQVRQGRGDGLRRPGRAGPRRCPGHRSGPHLRPSHRPPVGAGRRRRRRQRPGPGRRPRPRRRPGACRRLRQALRQGGAFRSGATARVCHRRRRRRRLRRCHDPRLRGGPPLADDRGHGHGDVRRGPRGAFLRLQDPAFRPRSVLRLPQRRPPEEAQGSRGQSRSLRPLEVRRRACPVRPRPGG